MSQIIPLFTENPTFLTTEDAEGECLLFEPNSSLQTSPLNKLKSTEVVSVETAQQTVVRIRSRWRKAFFKIRINRAIEKFNREIMLYGTSNEVFDQDRKFKQNLDKIIKKKAGKEEDFRYAKWDEEVRLLPWYIIDPDGFFKRYWNLLISVVLIYTALIMPYRLAFYELIFFDSWTIIELSIDGLFLTDMILSFVTAIYSYEGTLHSNLKFIVTSYLRSWFIIDITSSIPYSLIDFISGASEDGSNSHYNNLLKLARVPRLYKLLRIIRIAKAFKHYKKNDLADKLQDFLQLNSRIYKLLAFLVSVCLCVHIMGCLWFFSAKINEFSPDTWVVRCNYIDSPVSAQYIASIYWAFTTITTVGYGDIAARTEFEQMLAMGWMLAGIGFYSFTIGSLSSFLTAIDTKESILTSKLAAIHEFAQETGISPECKHKIRQIIKYNNSKVGTVWSDKHSLFNELPKALRYEVSATMYNGVVKELIFVKDQDPAFVISVMPLLRPMQHTDLDYLYVEGTYPDEMYFITKGRVNLVLNENEICYKSFLKGSYIGDVEILTKKSNRENNAQVCGESEFLVLSRKDLLNVLIDFPDEFKNLVRIAREREMRNRKAKEEMEAVIEIQKTTGNLKHLEGKGNIFERNAHPKASTIVIKDRLSFIQDETLSNTKALEGMKQSVNDIELGLKVLISSLQPRNNNKKKIKTVLGAVYMKYS